MRMGCMASWADESLFQRPPSEDRGCHRKRNAQGSGRSHLRSRDLHRQALRHQGHKRGFGEPLHDVPRHSSDRFHAQKGGRTATERDEFLRAAWRVMVAAEVDPSRLVFVDEMGLHTSLAPLYGYSPKGERVRLEVPRNRGKNTTLLASMTLLG